MRRLVTTVLMGLATFGQAAQAESSRPRLVVGIVVDQLRTDYIELLQNYFGDRGFKTLLTDGVYIRDVDFRVPRLDATASTAMLLTGSYPAQTGVPSASYYDTSVPGGALKLPLVTSNSANITNDSFTPEALHLSTLGDEYIIDSGGYSSVYSIAPEPQQAVILAGHCGKGAYWVNNTSGNWVTSSYYGGLPSALSARNMRNSLSHRIDTMVWRPSAKLSRVAGLPEYKRNSPFKYSFSRYDRDVFKKFALTPMANTEITDVAIEIINNLPSGATNGGGDMVNIAYTLAPYRYASEGNARTELTDAYLRLDADIGRLIQAIDRKVGRGNALIWLSSTGYFDDALPADPRYRLPGGEFSTRKARSLLNSYLSARYGSAGYISAIRDGQIFFDRQAIEQMRLDSDKVISDARQFLIKMSGVSDARTLSEVLSPRTKEEENLRLGLDPRVCGDIIVDFTPGWTVSYDDTLPAQQRVVRENVVMTPAMIMAPGLSPAKIETPVAATALAPTVAGLLHIRSPNGARSRATSLTR